MYFVKGSERPVKENYLSENISTEFCCSPWLSRTDLVIRGFVQSLISDTLLGTAAAVGGGGRGGRSLGSGLVTRSHGPPVSRTLKHLIVYNSVERCHYALPHYPTPSRPVTPSRTWDCCQHSCWEMGLELGSCWRTQSGGSWRYKIFRLNISLQFYFYLEGGEVGSLETGSREFEVLEPDLLEWSLR